MATAMNKLAIEAAMSQARTARAQVELRDDREPGLRFRAGERSAGWSLLVRLKNGQKSRVKLGTWPGMGIADARGAARDVRARIVQGENPNEEKRVAVRAAAIEAQSRTTLAAVIDLYEQQVLRQHRTGAATRRALDGKQGLLTTLRGRQPASITRDEVANLVRQHGRSAPISANRKLAYASAFFNWCVEEGVIPTSPAGRIRKPARENQRDRFHSMNELKEIWDAAGTLGYPFAQLYRLLIALPNRRDEVAGMPLDDLSLGCDEARNEGVWILPAARTKRANALRVPLSPLARSIICEAIAHPDRPKGSGLVFTTTGDTPVSGFAKAKRRLDRAIVDARTRDRAQIDGNEAEPMPHWTVHDLRTTFNTHACETLGVAPHVADRILNHVASATSSKIMRVYNKSELFEPRREALAHWGDLLTTRIVQPSRSSDE